MSCGESVLPKKNILITIYWSANKFKIIDRGVARIGQGRYDQDQFCMQGKQSKSLILCYDSWLACYHCKKLFVAYDVVSILDHRPLLLSTYRGLCP